MSAPRYSPGTEHALVVSYDLLSCPFCGGAAVVEEVPTGLGADGVSFSVGCDSPDEVACMGYQNLQTFSRRSEAVAGWNKRDLAVAQTAPSAVVVEALDNSQSLLVMVFHLAETNDGGIPALDWANEDLSKLVTEQIAENRGALSNQGASK